MASLEIATTGAVQPGRGCIDGEDVARDVALGARAELVVVIVQRSANHFNVHRFQPLRHVRRVQFVRIRTNR